MAMQKQLLSVHPMHEMPCLTAAARRGEKKRGAKIDYFLFPSFLFTLF